MSNVIQAVKERPVLFSGEMVRAILEGRKVQTRRIVKLPAMAGGTDWIKSFHQDGGGSWIAWSGDSPALADFTKRAYPNGEGIKCPYGAPGERLWVKESFYYDMLPFARGGSLKEKPANFSQADFYYRADGECCQQIPECCCCEVGPVRWRNARFMPRWASRLTLEIESVRVERLQDISEADAIAEGVSFLDEWSHDHTAHERFWKDFKSKSGSWSTNLNAVSSYRTLWESINGADSWAANPWVWVIGFKKV